MEQSSELWFFTTISILAACGVGCLVRIIFNRILKHLQVEQRWILFQISEAFNSCMSTYMLIVGTYEKCILIGEQMVLEYYITTVVLSVVYCYILSNSAPNPLPVLVKHWKDVFMEDEKHLNDVEANGFVEQQRNVDGLRRRGGEVQPAEEQRLIPVRRKRRQSRPTVTMVALRQSVPSLIGLYFGMFAAIQWLHLAWDGYLTNHHLTKTGLLRDCIIVLQTGPVQGFVIEGFITFLFLFTSTRLKNINATSHSFFIQSCAYSIITTSTLYIFINVTGSFANPLLAYALERECLYDVTSIVNHIIVYWLGAFAGAVAYYAMPAESHSKVLLSLPPTLILAYYLIPGVLENNFLLF